MVLTMVAGTCKDNFNHTVIPWVNKIWELLKEEFQDKISKLSNASFSIKVSLLYLKFKYLHGESLPNYTSYSLINTI